LLSRFTSSAQPEAFIATVPEANGTTVLFQMRESAQRKSWRLRSPQGPTATYSSPYRRARQALEDLLAGKVFGRLVLTP
jgi:hypothetical protein